MMILNSGKSALLAVAMMFTIPATTRTQGAVPAKKIAQEGFGKNVLLSAAAVTLFAAWADLKTNSNKEMFETTLAEDYEKLVASFSFLDTGFYKKAATLLRKVIIGRPIKFVQKDIPQKDGSTIKGKKTLSQEPYGALGLFDAYVLSQIKDFTENIPLLAGLYVLLGYPERYVADALIKAGIPTVEAVSTDAK